MKQYIKSRPVASTESIARIKNEFKPKLDLLPASYMFRNSGSSDIPNSTASNSTSKVGANVLQQGDLLQQLKNYKSKTVGWFLEFEFFTSDMSNFESFILIVHPHGNFYAFVELQAVMTPFQG